MIIDSVRHWRISVAMAFFLLGIIPLQMLAKGRMGRLDTAKILEHMDRSARHLKTLSAHIKYTKVTVVVNDFSTESGQMYFRNAKSPDVLVHFTIPAPKIILLKKDKAEIYQPRINQIQQFDLSKHASMFQQFLSLGFGSSSKDIKKTYKVKYLKEEQLGGDTTALLELIPRKASIAAQLPKIHLWISEESWLPVQQKFFEASGDYSIARYSSVKVNRDLPSSTFQIHAAKGAKRVKM